MRRSLFGLLSSPRNLGTVALSGWIEIERANESAPTNLERAIAPKRPAPTPPPTQQPGAEPITLPPLRMTLDVSDLRFSYELAGKKIGISKLAIKGPLTLDGQTDISINAVPSINGNEATGRTITASVKSGPLLNASRELTIAGSGLELTVDANLPGEYAAVISGLLGEPVTTAAGASSEPIRLRANIREQSGRLVASGNADALSVEGPLPPALIARLAPAGTLRITQPGAFTLRTTRFDLPVALITAGLNSTDLRDSALLLALETQPVGATLTTDGLPPKSLRIEPIDLRFGSENFAQRAFVQGDIRALIDNTPAGTVLLDARVDNLLGPGGTLAPIAQVRPAGQIRLVDAPASLVDSFTAGIDALGTGFARDVFGETINLTLDAESRADLGSDDTALESPKLALSIDSANTTVRATAILDGDRIEAPGEALSIQSSAGRGILTRFAPQVLAEMDAESDAQRPIVLTVSATDLTLIQGTDTPIDLDRLRRTSAPASTDSPQPTLASIASSSPSTPPQTHRSTSTPSPPETEMPERRTPASSPTTSPRTFNSPASAHSPAHRTRSAPEACAPTAPSPSSVPPSKASSSSPASTRNRSPKPSATASTAPSPSPPRPMPTPPHSTSKHPPPVSAPNSASPEPCSPPPARSPSPRASRSACSTAWISAPSPSTTSPPCASPGRLSSARPSRTSNSISIVLMARPRSLPASAVHRSKHPASDSSALLASAVPTPPSAPPPSPKTIPSASKSQVWTPASTPSTSTSPPPSPSTNSSRAPTP
ncbi:hypothetical protein ABWH91_12490 [Phycisphaerales bacterium ac7]